MKHYTCHTVYIGMHDPKKLHVFYRLTAKEEKKTSISVGSLTYDINQLHLSHSRPSVHTDHDILHMDQDQRSPQV